MEKNLASIFSTQCKILFMYMCRERVLDIWETCTPFFPPSTHTPGKAWGGGSWHELLLRLSSG